MDDNINIDRIQANGNFDFTNLYTEVNHYKNEIYHDYPFL